NAVKAMLGVEQHIAHSSLEKPLIALVRLRASQINGCAYCIDMHATEARKIGESERRLNTVAVWRETPFFSDRERAALEWRETVTRVKQTHAPDEVGERVKPFFTPKELVDLTVLIGAINTWTRLAIGFRNQLPA